MPLLTVCDPVPVFAGGRPPFVKWYLPWQVGAETSPLLSPVVPAQVNGNVSDTVCPSVEMTCQVIVYAPGAPIAAGIEMPGPSTDTQPSP